MKKRILILLTTFVLLGLTGCNNATKNATGNILTIENDGIIDISVEDYSGVDFSEEDLKTYIDSQVTAFTAKKQGAVTVGDMYVQGDTVKLSMNYDTLETYNAFNGTEYQITPGNIWSDEDENRMFKSTDAKELDKTALDGILAEDGVSVLEISGQTAVKVNGKVLAYAGCTLVDESTVEVTEEVAIVVYK